jgi:hypothetical protein
MATDEDKDAFPRFRPSSAGFEEPHDVVKGFLKAKELTAEEPVPYHVFVVGDFHRVLDGLCPLQHDRVIDPAGCELRCGGVLFDKSQVVKAGAFPIDFLAFFSEFLDDFLKIILWHASSPSVHLMDCQNPWLILKVRAKGNSPPTDRSQTKGD